MTDLSMPNLDGMGGTPAMVQLCVPLIPMTAQETAGSGANRPAVLFTEVIFKPVDVERFLNMIDRLKLQNGFSPHT